MLKNCWDLVSVVTYLFDSWRLSLWMTIDIDVMEARCRELSKEMRRLDKEMKGWDGMMRRVRNNMFKTNRRCTRRSLRRTRSDGQGYGHSTARCR